MTALYPQWFQWSGEAMVPLNPKAADRQYVVGERYFLEHIEQRSSASHAHFFAAVAEAHANLPDALAQRFRTPDALRKYALIMTGHRDQRSIVCPSKASARDFAAFVEPMDEFAVVVVHESTVVVMTAKSQSMRAMGKADFQRSKDDVLDYVASLIGVPVDRLQSERAA